MFVLGRILNAIIPFSVIAIALAYALVLLSYSPTDPGWNNLNAPDVVSNLGGVPGAYVADISYYLFGFFAYLIPICIVQFLWNYRYKWKNQKNGHILYPTLFFIGFLVALIGGCGLENLYGNYMSNYHYGGILGFEIARAVEPYMDAEWAAVFFGLLCFGGTLVVGVPWIRLIGLTGSAILSLIPNRTPSKLGHIETIAVAQKSSFTTTEPEVNWQPEIEEYKQRTVEVKPRQERRIQKRTKQKRVKQKRVKQKRVKHKNVRKKGFKSRNLSLSPKSRKTKSSYKDSLERKDPMILPIWNVDADNAPKSKSEFSKQESVESVEPVEFAEPMDSVEQLTNNEYQFTDEEPLKVVKGAKNSQLNSVEEEFERNNVQHSNYEFEQQPIQEYPEPTCMDDDLPTEEEVQDFHQNTEPTPDDSNGSSFTTVSSFPDTSVLDPTMSSEFAFTQSEIKMIGLKIENMLADFNVGVRVRDAKSGPVITQFEIEPAPGIKANRIVNLASDLARTLTVESVRVVENIPGSPYVGVEVPNKKRETVPLIDGLEDEGYRSSTHPLTLMLGKDILGKTVVSNLAKMPHLLIAGTTGAGKSVCLNAILLSFLFKSTAEELRLIIVDPKMLEFSVYEGIPHLLAPVITDVRKTENALKWCISEMERRFELMAKLNTRNVENFNDKIRNSREPIFDPTAPDPNATPPLRTFPYIVVIIDELADLIMVLGRKAEELIIRIAQRARAAGIHLIVATQRPSADVIRGVLKANIPTRIGFRVASNADSRTILDQTGAENLLGMGDMLFIPPGSAVAKRVHGAFVSDEEVQRVVDSIKETSPPQYDPGVTRFIDNSEDNGTSNHYDTIGEKDVLYDKAFDFVIRSQRPSISSVQRHMRIGYNRAANIIESMEKAGAISPPGPGGRRQVLVSKPQD